MPLIITTHNIGNVEVLKLTGRLTLGDATSELRELAVRTLESGQHILFDFSALDYMDSAGLGELVSIHMSAASRNKQVKLLRPMKRVTQLLHMTKLLSTFEVFENKPEAVASFE